MSAISPKADTGTESRNVRLVPKAAIAPNSPSDLSVEFIVQPTRRIRGLIGVFLLNVRQLTVVHLDLLVLSGLRRSLKPSHCRFPHSPGVDVLVGEDVQTFRS